MKPGISLASLLCCLGSAIASAATSSPQDFASGFRVEAAGSGPIWELALPEAVYRGVVRPDLRDLRVFDAAGGVVPHALQLPKPPETSAPSPVELAVFPLYRRHRGESGTQVLRIVTNEKGAVIDATAATTPADDTDRVEAYLIDASALEQAPCQLYLDWRRDAVGGGFAVAVAVEASDDLAHWQTVARDVTIADLQAGDAVLAHRDIRLPALRARYLRISWPEPLRQTELVKVVASFAPRVGPVERRWIEVGGKAGRGDPFAYVYDSGGQRAVDRLRVVFPDGNALLHGTLQSSARPDGPWRTRHTGVHYGLRRGDARLESEPAQMPAVTDRYWRFVPEGGGTVGGGVAPALAFGWTPHQLRFVAQGEPPYTVAFGSVSSDDAPRLPGTLDQNEVEGLTVPATASEVFDLGGPARLRVSPWRAWLLWGVLVGCLAVLAWMVRRLMRQLGGATPAGPGDC